MLPTPDTSHVNFDRIYEPAEDSYLVLDTLSSDAESRFLQSQFAKSVHTPIVVEVGTGSGVVLAFVTAHAQAIIGRSDALTLGVDVNSFACQATVETVRRACKSVQQEEAPPAKFLGCFNSDLTTNLLSRSVDLLIFNPPYVPSENPPSWQGMVQTATLTGHEAFERDSRLLALSYAGGHDGMEITNRLLAEIPRVLSAEGVAYVLLCAQNRPIEVQNQVQLWPGSWSAEIVGSSGKKAGWEKLCIMRICCEAPGPFT